MVADERPAGVARALRDTDTASQAARKAVHAAGKAGSSGAIQVPPGCAR